MIFIAVVQKGNYQTLHAGGHDKRYRTSFIYHDDDFFVEMQKLRSPSEMSDLAMGAPLVASDTHKSNLPNPLIHTEHSNQGRNPGDGEKKKGVIVRITWWTGEK